MEETDIIINTIESCCEPNNDYLFNFILTLLASGIAFWTALYFDRRAKKREQKKETKIQKEENKKEDEKKEKELKDRLHYLTTLIISIEKTVNQQSEKCSEYIQSIEKRPYEINHLSIIASNDIQRVLALDAQSTFFAYRYFFQNRLNWLQEYSKFNTEVDYIEGTLGEIKRLYFSNKDVVTVNLLDYKRIVETIRGYLSKTLMAFNAGTPSYTFLSQMIIKYDELLPSNFKDYDDQFLNSLKKQIETDFFREQFAERILEMINRAKGRLHDIEVECIDTTEQFRIIINELKSSLVILKETRERVENNVH